MLCCRHASSGRMSWNISDHVHTQCCRSALLMLILPAPGVTPVCQVLLLLQRDLRAGKVLLTLSHVTTSPLPPSACPYASPQPIDPSNSEEHEEIIWTILLLQLKNSLLQTPMANTCYLLLQATVFTCSQHHLGPFQHGTPASEHEL